MANFSIPDIPPKTDLNKGTVDAVSGKAISPHTGSVQFAVNNSADEIIDGKLSVQPDGQAKAEWFSIDGAAQRDFKNSASETVKVNISVPADVAQGEYSFRLLAAAVTDPDNDFAISQSTAFTVPEAEKVGGKKKSLWWLWLLIGLVVLAIIGGLVWFLTNRPANVPNLIDLSEEKAKAELEDNNLEVGKIGKACSTEHKAGTVSAQKPEKNQEVEKGTKVDITIATQPTIFRGKPTCLILVPLEVKPAPGVFLPAAKMQTPQFVPAPK